ncbi:glucan biosynthesis protein, partial [Paenibacillus macquariensis]
MNKKYSEFISWTKDNGWDITDKSEYELNLNDSIASRYKEIPEGYLDFLKRVKECITPSEKTWFICEDEYNNNSDSAFKWNEFEVLSLEAAENDEKWKSEITSWWDKYLPIVMSVDDGYSFYAIDLTNDIGAIVQG